MSGPTTEYTPNSDVLLTAADRDYIAKMCASMPADDYSWLPQVVDALADATRARKAAERLRDASDLQDVLGACLGVA